MNRFIIILMFFSVGVFMFSCRKSDENLDVDLSKYNPDITSASELDKWISTNFTEPYNIEVVYRFNRDLGNTQRDIAPVKLDQVNPIMDAVSSIFLKPYEKIAGKTFIRTYTPKQFVLFGSVSYNTNGSVTLGTADGGRRVVLYDVNNFDPLDGDGVKRDMRTIHHEFTHILNQTVRIPQEFEAITKSDYVTDWTNSLYTAAEAKALGFISRYSRLSYTEDFAEMTSHLLVEGQIWFENYLATAPSALAAEKLRKKEELVISYFKEYFNVDFKALQAEVQFVLKNKYNATDPADLSKTFVAYLKANKVATITYNPASDVYATYGFSTVFNKMWTNYKNAVATQIPNANQRFPQSLLFTFTSSSKMTVRVNYLNNAQTSSLAADYDFDFVIDATTGEIKFSKVIPEGATTAHGNGGTNNLKPYFEQYLLPYFTNRIFIADWLPTTITPTNSLYRTYGGFYEKGTVTNYFYGPIVLK